jgi:DNA-binding beta-propeller fold protein YncE
MKITARTSKGGRNMGWIGMFLLGAMSIGVILFSALPGPAWAEILAMLNYESKPEESLRAMRIPVPPLGRREGVAIVDVDPQSPDFGKIVTDLPVPADVVAHHIFYNKDASKAYLTALGKGELRVIDMKRKPYEIKTIPVPECKVGEDVVFSDDNKRWYLTCMGSQNVVVGDATTDKPLRSIALPKPYPHGIAIHEGIDRMLVTSTVRATDLKDAGETITVLELSSGKPLSSPKLSSKPSPAGEAPVEVLFLPNSKPPVAFVTNMYGGTLWVAAWNPATKDFDVSQAFDFESVKGAVPLELYVNPTGTRLYVTTAKPGHFHIFDIAKDPKAPKLLKTLPAAEGAHHVAFTKDWRYAFVQNALLSLPGMSDGSITVIDLTRDEVVGTVDTLKKQGFNPNSIVLLPDWNHPAGH